MTFTNGDNEYGGAGAGGGNGGWLILYAISLFLVTALDCMRSFDLRIAEIVTNCIVFLGINYILNDYIGGE